MRRQKSMRAVALTLLSLGIAAPACAQTAAEYPKRSIRLLVPFAPGGGTDIIADRKSTRLNSSH